MNQASPDPAPTGAAAALPKGHGSAGVSAGWGGTEIAGRAAILITVCMWGAQYPVMNELAQRWDVYTLIISRYVAAMAIFLAVERLTRRPAATAIEVPILRRAALGAAMALFAVLFTLGVAMGDPVTTAIVAALSPMTASLVAWATTGERPNMAVLVALLLVIPGAVLASADLSGGAVRGNAAAGAALMIVAQACWSWYSIIAQRWLAGLGQIVITSRSFGWSLPYLVVVYGLAVLAGGIHIDFVTSPVYDASAFLLLTAGSLALGVLLWNLSVARLGLHVTALHLNLIPVVAMLVAFAHGTVPHLEQLAGAALVIAGVVMAQTRGIGRPTGAMRRTS